MQFTLATLSTLLPALALTSPLIASRQPSPCAPTSYSLTNFRYTSGSSSGASVHFNFKSSFSNPSIIVDPASSGATCDAAGPSGTIPNSNECSTPNRSLLFDLRAPQDQADYQIIHSWQCNGQQWMSSTPHKFQPLDCERDDSGATVCTSQDVEVQPQNVRQICNGPTCP